MHVYDIVIKCMLPDMTVTRFELSMKERGGVGG